MSNATILVIDETPDHREFLSRLLGAVGYAVIATDTSEGALGQAQHQQPDLILLSLPVPGDQGWEAARQLGTQSPLAQTPILGTTMYTPLVNQSGARSLGCVDFVEKPFNIDYLLNRIAALLPLNPTAVAA